jgi:hypothetical protein
MLRYVNSLLRSLETRLFNRRIQRALKLNLRGEGRSDGLPLKSANTSLELEWHARDIHPWDKALPSRNADAQFVNQAIQDTDAVLMRLFATLPHVDTINVFVYEPSSDGVIMSGEVMRTSLAGPRPLSDRIWRGQLGIRFHIIDNRFQPLVQSEERQRGRFKPQSIENHCI